VHLRPFSRNSDPSLLKEKAYTNIVKFYMLKISLMNNHLDSKNYMNKSALAALLQNSDLKD
jgi:hypothetical protein